MRSSYKYSMFTEDAESDLMRSVRAEDFMLAIKKYLYNLEDQKLDTANINGVDHPVIWGKDVWGPGFFGDVLVAFYEDRRPYAGRAFKIPNNRYRYGIKIGVDDMSSTRLIYYALTDSKISQTVQHELQHIIDYKRKKDKREKDKKSFSDYDNPKDDELSDYYNSPAELNAYFHNIAEPLLSRMRFIQKHGLEAAQIYPDLEDNFRDYYTNHVVNMTGRYQPFWNNLNELNRRKVIKRLKNLFDLFVEFQAKYADT